MPYRRIAISAGHTNVPGKDRGAVGNKQVEGNLTVEFRDLIKEQLNNWGITVSVDPNSSATGDMVRLFSKYFNGKDIVVDIHFNAAISEEANGTEVLIPASPTDFERDLAYELVREISSFGFANRGVKSELQSARKKLFFFTVPAETVLIEVCFISNARDMELYQA